MATVVLFHSVMGVTPGLAESAEMLRSNGHEVHVIDQYDGRTFDDYEPAMAHMESIGMEPLMAKALELTPDLADGFVTAGFSNGAGMAEYVAARKPGARGVLMFAGAIDPKWLEVSWPEGVPGQIHTTVDDPWRDEGIDGAAAAIEAAGGQVEVFDYPGSGHLFADSSRPSEYQQAEAELMWSRVLEFLKRVG